MSPQLVNVACGEDFGTVIGCSRSYRVVKGMSDRWEGLKLGDMVGRGVWNGREIIELGSL